MMFDIFMLLPATQNAYQGPNIAIWFLIIINIIGTIRSLIHMFSRDGGAQSIATMNLNVNGKQNIVAIFCQWGAVQLIIAMIIWIVLWRYREFVPWMIAEILIEQVLRIAIGRMKPVLTIRTPPGHFASFILLPISVIMLFVSLIRTE